MNIKYKEILPQWYLDKEDYNLVLSDDLDSLLSCAILNKVSGWKIKYFYDFGQLYKSKGFITDRDKRVWVDVATLKGEKAFDNHVSMVSLDDDIDLSNTINPNVMCYITSKNYAEKYAGSTALMLWSLYDLPLPETEEGKMILLSIDSAFLGHYKAKFEQQNTFYLRDVFEFNELYKVLKRHDIDDFYRVIGENNLKKKIEYKDGKIYTDLDIDKIGKKLGIDLNIIPQKSFEIVEKYYIQEKKISNEKKVKDICKNAFSLAFTFSNKVRYSKINYESFEF